MGKKSKTKGKLGELEAESVLRELGWDAHRTSLLQARGDDESDIVAWSPDERGRVPHKFEVKYRNSGFTAAYSALQQAIDAVNDGEVPASLVRQTDTPRKRDWLIVMRLEDYTRQIRGE